MTTTTIAILIFIAVNIFNVTIQTVKSIMTIKAGKQSAAVINAVAYGVYTVINVYTVTSDLDLFTKGLIVGIINYFCVYGIKHAEEKMQKDKLWKIDATVKTTRVSHIREKLKAEHIPHTYITIEESDITLINIYSATQAESKIVKKLLEKYEAKYFATESKNL